LVDVVPGRFRTRRAARKISGKVLQNLNRGFAAGLILGKTVGSLLRNG
jgi:hypothetical protein